MTQILLALVVIIISINTVIFWSAVSYLYIETKRGKNES
jgi:hypothetical protein